MIRLGTIRDEIPGYGKWLIVRSLKNQVEGALHVPVLSPSTHLFRAYLSAKAAGQFTEKWFQDTYVPWFLKDMIHSQEAVALLDQLYRDSFTKNILLCCFCANENLCHRSIVGGMLKGAGAKVECDDSYVRYWQLFQEACRK